MRGCVRYLATILRYDLIVKGYWFACVKPHPFCPMVLNLSVGLEAELIQASLLTWNGVQMILQYFISCLNVLSIGTIE